MKITALVLVIFSVAITYISQNLFLHDLALGLAVMIFGISCFSSLRNKKSLKHPKLAKGATYFVSTLICIIGIIPIYAIAADQFGKKTIIVTDKVRHYGKPVSHNKDALLNVGQVYIGEGLASYSFSLKNPDVAVLKEIKGFPDQQGPDKVFKMTVAPNSQHILKAEVVGTN